MVIFFFYFRKNAFAKQTFLSPCYVQNTVSRYLFKGRITRGSSILFVGIPATRFNTSKKHYEDHQPEPPMGSQQGQP